MRKALIIISLIIFLALSVLFYLSFLVSQESIEIEHETDQSTNKIIILLEQKKYAEAFLLYESMDSENQKNVIVEIDKYTRKICEIALNNLSKDELIIYKNSGGDFDKVEDTINAIDEIIILNDKIKVSEENFKEAVELYNARQFIDSRVAFAKVIEQDENYLNAQEYLSELDVRDFSWSNNLIKQKYHNECAYDGRYLYIAYVLDGIDGIYKIDANGKAVDFFPLSSEKSVLNITCINVVGEYLYFIAGENVGSGYAFDSPYCIYEMKTDGSKLTLLLEGNFVNLAIIKDTVYAISREHGLIKYDKNFNELETVSSDNVVEFTFNSDGMYYIVQGDLTYDSDNTAYFYDGESSAKIETKEYLHYYRYDEKYIKLWQSATVSESLYLYDKDKEYKIATMDIGKFIGMIDNKVIYTAIGSVGQEVYRAFNLDTETPAYLPIVNNLSEFEILGLFYEDNKLIVKKDGKLYFSNADGGQQTEVEQINFSVEILEENSKIIKHIETDDIYVESGEQPLINIITDKQNWIYRNDELLIVLEKRFVDEYDCNVYITHIYTENFELLTTGNYNTSSLSAGVSYKASKISDKYNAVYAQSTDAFYYGANYYLGIIIRQGTLVRDILYDDMIAYYDDGHMEVFRDTDNVTGSQLIDAGALMSFSFGPILVEDYQVNTESAFKKLTARNPRSAIGYVEPGHYVMIACDGRDYSVSRGLNMIQLAYMFKNEGCSLAYNLDGGQTTTVLFMGNYITQRPKKVEGSQQHLHRYIAEIFYVGTDEASPLDLNSYKINYEDYKKTYK